MNHVILAQGPGMGPPGDVFLVLGWLFIVAHVLIIGACWIIIRRILGKPKEPNLPRALLLWLGGVVGAAIAPLSLFALAPSFISCSLGISPLEALGEGDAGPLLLYVVIPMSILPAVVLEIW